MLKKETRNLFLIDGIGAIVSLFMLGFVLVRLQELVGMPTPILMSLAIAPGFFAVNSLYRYFRPDGAWRKHLKIIAVFNLLYCSLTAGLVIYFKDELTGLGVLYFVGEMIIVVTLSIIELRAASAE